MPRNYPGLRSEQGGKRFCSLVGFAAPCRGMVSLTDPQLKIVMTAANAVPVERRSVFLERVGAMLTMRGRFSDADVADVAKLSSCGVINGSRAAPRNERTVRI